MTKKRTKATQNHLTIEDREYIEEALKNNLTFKEMSEHLFKHPTTISKEVKKRRISKEASRFNSSGNQCKFEKTCTKTDLCNVKKCKFPCRKCFNCNTVCPEFEKMICVKLKKAPFVCNGCSKKSPCRLEKQYYRSTLAQREYLETLKCTREGINMTTKEFKELDSLISPLVQRGQSLAHIHSSHKDELFCTRRTLYRYFEKNLFSAGNLDLPRKVRYKKRKSKIKKQPYEYAAREGRTYQEFLVFIAENPTLSIVEMDTVEGLKGGKVLLTLLIRSCRLQLVFLLPDKTQNSVLECFNYLYKCLGKSLFNYIFGVILTDNGSEFLNPLSLEYDDTGLLRTRIYYCDPNASYQKGMIEKNHEYIRYILPKGTSFDSLLDKDVLLIVNHINSARRDSMNGKTPFEVAEFLLPVGFLHALGYLAIPSDEILLKPDLIR